MSTIEQATYSARAQRHASIDKSVERCGSGKTARIDLGLHLLSIARKPGSEFTLQEIALWCGCTRDAILLIEEKAKKKLANQVRFGAASRIFREVA